MLGRMMLGQAGEWWPAWDLFGDAILVGTMLAIALPLGGVLLVLRQQMFVAAAIGQAATLGVALALACGLGSAHALTHGAGRGAALACACAAAAVTAIAALRALSVRQSTLENRSAWTFLISGSVAMLLLDGVPHGPQAVQQLFLSSLLTVAPGEVGMVAVGAALTLGAAARSRRLLLWAIDPTTAAAHGAHLVAHDVVVGALLGLWLGWAIFTAGLLFTFGATVLPVLAARAAARSLRGVLVLAPLLGGGGQWLAFVLAHRLDLPPAQVFVALQGTLAMVARLVARR